MLHYKLVYQNMVKDSKFYDYIDIENIIVGNEENSVGILYTPSNYTEWLREDSVFKTFIEFDIIQTIITNTKFRVILEMHEKLNLLFSDCEFYGLTSDEVDSMINYNDINKESIDFIIDKEEYRLKKMIFRTKSCRFISINRNGVISFQEDSMADDLEDIKKLIDFINIGPRVLK